MQNNKRPYLVIPYFIEQPTWGGRYILRAKGWDNRKRFDNIKIGQSYELFSKTRLATRIFSSDDPSFTPDTDKVHSPVDAIAVSGLESNLTPPLIKFTQAKGNSFQLHRKPEVPDAHWRPKAESWYYFEPGKITFGIRKGVDVEKYKQCCVRINAEMTALSNSVKNGQLQIEEARKKIAKFVKIENPWQYVNVYHVPADGVVDLSGGGLHHSWEEDAERCPLGNVVYEVQQDVMDPECTLRSFDQGKIMDDGNIRTIHIDDYFRHLDTNESRNTLSLSTGDDGMLFNSPHYKLKKIKIIDSIKTGTSQSFHHLFIKTGNVTISAGGVEIKVGAGHSCFIPSDTPYTIEPQIETVILQTYL